MKIYFDPLLNSRDSFPTIVNKLEIFIREKSQRWYPIFPRVSTFSAPLYLNRLLGKTGTFREPRSSIFPRNLVPLPPFYPSIHPVADIYTKARKFRLSSPANWQFRLSGISGAPFYSTPEFRLSSSFRATPPPLFKVGNTLAHLLAPPPLVLLPCPLSDAGRSRIADTPCCFAVWSRSRGIKHREILPKNENFSCIDNIPSPLSLFSSWEGIRSLSDIFCALYKYINIGVKNFQFSSGWRETKFSRVISFFFFFVK